VLGNYFFQIKAIHTKCTFIFCLARERMEFNKSCTVIGSERAEFSHPACQDERNPPCWSIFVNELEVIVNLHIFTLTLTINQLMIISIHFSMAKEVTLNKFKSVNLFDCVAQRCIGAQSSVFLVAIWISSLSAQFKVEMNDFEWLATSDRNFFVVQLKTLHWTSLLKKIWRT